MKKYITYMDGVSVSDTLHRRLLSLEPPRKRPVWTKYGTIAAALVLVASLGGFAVWAARINGLDAPIPFYPPGFQQAPEVADANAEPGTPDVDIPENSDIGEPDIAPAEPGDIVEPGPKTLGGYEVVHGSGPDAVVSYHVLPYIEYGEAEGISLKIALEQVLGEGYTEGPVTREEIAALLGGEDVLSAHLDWDGYDVSGWLYRRADGSPGLLMVNGYAGPRDRFAFSVMDGRLPPTCIAYPESVTQEIWGLTVTADKYDWELETSPSWGASERRVSFMKDDCGYRFEMSSASADEAEEMVSRLVARIAEKGLSLDALSP